MANRTVIVDNYTWNNTHIATVGTAISSPGKIFNSLDVKYMFVIFRGRVGYPSNDINMFLWMVRIGGCVFPHIKEPDYLRDGNYRIDSMGLLRQCLILSCINSLITGMWRQTAKGFDLVRWTEIGKKYFKLNSFRGGFHNAPWDGLHIQIETSEEQNSGGKAKKTKSKATPASSSSISAKQRRALGNKQSGSSSRFSLYNGRQEARGRWFLREQSDFSSQGRVVERFCGFLERQSGHNNR